MSQPSTVASIKEGQGHASDKRRCRPKGSRKQAGKDRWREREKKRERERERERECATLNLQTRPDKKLCFFLRENEK